jgi:antirestriction protein ArdC
MPCNAATCHRYRGINTLILGTSPLAFTSGDPRWATYKQSEERGWQVRKGERGTTGFLFRRLEIRDDTKPDDDEDSVRRIPLLRAFTLFHASQIDGIPDYVPPTIEEAPWRAPEATEIMIANSGAIVRFGGDRAFYGSGAIYPGTIAGLRHQRYLLRCQRRLPYDRRGSVFEAQRAKVELALMDPA